ncbi:MAG TPA: VOC family protein [Acidobacteriaceae bacterium]|jgi:glyoxalase family protein|nr:VOC family protein [Acidobacteriaceae bacterium]
MPAQPIVGLHHVTAIASDPQANLDFYTQGLGLRFVKRTVNFDDPGTYHFYFGDDLGSPGTILTFFPWPRVGRGTAGVGEVTHTAFSIPRDSLAYWEQRLVDLHIPFTRSPRRFDEEVLTLADPDGMKIELVAHAEGAAAHPPRFSDVPSAHAIRGFFGVTMLQLDATETAAALNVMGFRQIAAEGQRLRFASPADPSALGNHIDILVDPQANFGRSGAGSVHHIAFRAANDESQLDWRAEITGHLPATEVLDREYFHSIYFREPGGVLFELATDNPGFAIDEPVESLGERLCLPPWFESRRTSLEELLPSLTLHTKTPAAAGTADPQADPVPPPNAPVPARAKEDPNDPHAEGELYRAGAPLDHATGAVILLHGRGGAARDILTLSRALAPASFPIAFLAPQAEGFAWYPNSFLAERDLNQPFLDSALARVQSVIGLALAAGIPLDRIVLAGFSQGACLASEFIATHPARYGGLIALTGGLIGPPDSDLTHSGDLAGTPALFASSDPDQWVPWPRVEESAKIFTAMGAQVTLRRFPDKPHSVSGEEIELGRKLIEKAFTPTK